MYPIEVKEQGGDYNQAVGQLAVWSAAALKKLQLLADMGKADSDKMKLLPYPGWTVVGHSWELHISWKKMDEDSGSVVGSAPSRLPSRHR